MQGTAIAFFQQLPGANFLINTAKPAANGALVTTGLEYQLGDGWSRHRQIRRRILLDHLDLCRHRHDPKGVVEFCMLHSRFLLIRRAGIGAFVAGALSIAGVVPVAAQQSTSATYQDWVLQCLIKPGPPPQKICAMAQVTQIQGKNIPFSRVAIERAAKGQLDKLSVQVPVNVSFAANVHIQTGNADPGIAAPFDRCLPAGCFADFELKDELLQKFRAADGAGKISFKDAAGHDVVIPLSFKGFREAFDALAKK